MTQETKNVLIGIIVAICFLFVVGMSCASEPSGGGSGDWYQNQGNGG